MTSEFLILRTSFELQNWRGSHRHLSSSGSASSDGVSAGRRSWISLYRCRFLSSDLSPLMLWHWISIDPHISSFNNIGGFKVCLNFVPIDTILIIHVIDDITQSISMTLFDGMARVSVKWTDFKIVETWRPGEWFISGQRNGFPGQKDGE